MTKQEFTKKWKAAANRVIKLHKQAEPIVFSRFGNDPSKSLAIPENMQKAKMILRKARQNVRLIHMYVKKMKALEQ